MRPHTSLKSSCEKNPYDDLRIVLTTEDGLGVSNTIVLELESSQPSKIT
ncbi:MAG: hypothetical protein WA673_22455 [Candidatus Acidiferrales bacterium]